MPPPTLLVQGFQRAFVDIESSVFSVSASMRRSTCEQVLKYARANGWTVIHAYLDADTNSEAASTLDGFSPWPGEAYVRQKTLSALRCSTLKVKLGELQDSPIYLISFAGVGVIGATFFDALEHRVPLQLVANGIADGGRTNLSERRGLAALEAMALAFGRSVRWPDLLTSPSVFQPALESREVSPPLSFGEPLLRRAQDLEALLLMGQYMLEEAPPMVASPAIVARSLEDVITELELAMDGLTSRTTECSDGLSRVSRRRRN